MNEYKKLGFYLWERENMEEREKVKMQSLSNAVEYKKFLLLSRNIHCATFFHFHWAAFKLDPRRRLTVNGEYSNAAQKKSFM